MGTYWEEKLNDLLTWIMTEEQFTKEELNLFRKLKDEFKDLLKEMKK